MSDKGLPTNEYDRLMGQFHGLPGVQQTRPSIIRNATFTGQTETWIVTTYRRSDEEGAESWVFLEHVDASGSQRFVLPPKVVHTIAKQADSLIGKARKAAAKQAAETRKERGIEPAFLNRKREA